MLPGISEQTSGVTTRRPSSTRLYLKRRRRFTNSPAHPSHGEVDDKCALLTAPIDLPTLLRLDARVLYNASCILNILMDETRERFRRIDYTLDGPFDEHLSMKF